MQILLIRHGRPETGTGDPDPALSEIGRVQARSLAGFLSRCGIVSILSSPLRRAMETAAPTSERLGLDVDARFAEQAKPLFIDINCGCWVPKIAGRGAGAGWLRDPAAMVEMARRTAAGVSLPVTVKTRIGLGPESHMPIVDLARRLEDAGVAAITIHCRTAAMGHSGAADWSWAARARGGTEVGRIGRLFGLDDAGVRDRHEQRAGPHALAAADMAGRKRLFAAAWRSSRTGTSTSAACSDR